MTGLLELTAAFLKIGAVSFGGGWTVVGIIQQEIVSRGWMDDAAFRQFIAIAQIVPGPIALNAATLSGFRLGGAAGALTAMLAVIVVPVLAVIFARTALGRLRPGPAIRLDHALRSGTMALVAFTFWSFAPQAAVSGVSVAMSVAAFCVAAFTKVSPLWVILVAGAVKVVTVL